MELMQDGAYQAAFGADDISSNLMKRAVSSWFDAYYSGGILKLPYTIVRKLVRGMFAEYETEGLLKGLPERTAMELALIGGEAYIKPVFLDGWGWRIVPRSAILVFGRDWEGEPTDVGLTEKRLWGRHYFTLLERRRLDSDGMLTVTNRLFRSGSRNELGREVELAACPAFASLPERYVYPQPVGSVGLVRLKLPVANFVDGSREGVSIFGAALPVIEAAEENEQQLIREFRNGASRLVVSRDMLRGGQLKDELFVALDDCPEQVGITVFSPELRQESFLARQQSYLRTVENIIGLKRGLLSEVEAKDRTATEITSSEGEYMTTLLDLQKAFRDAADKSVALVARLGGPEEECAIRWGDGVV